MIICKVVSDYAHLESLALLCNLGASAGLKAHVVTLSSRIPWRVLNLCVVQPTTLVYISSCGPHYCYISVGNAQHKQAHVTKSCTGGGGGWLQDQSNGRGGWSWWRSPFANDTGHSIHKALVEYVSALHPLRDVNSTLAQEHRIIVSSSCSTLIMD